MVIPRRFRFNLIFCVVVVLSTFCLLLFYQHLVCRRFIDVMLFVVLLRNFIYVRVIQTGNVDLISRRYQNMVISLLNNWSCIYSIHYIIKFVGFMPIYSDINLDIV